MRGTIYVDPTSWDLTVDASGNIAYAEAPYALAQDVASACKLFKGEQWYDTTKGVPYLPDILGTLPPPSFVRQSLINAALTVPDVVTVQCIIEALADRTVTGQVQFIDSEGVTSGVSF